MRQWLYLALWGLASWYLRVPRVIELSGWGQVFESGLASGLRNYKILLDFSSKKIKVNLSRRFAGAEALVAVLSASSTGGSWAGDLTSQRVADRQKAWAGLNTAHEALARRFLIRLGVPNEALDEVCQRVFLGTFRYLQHFQQETSFSTWLCRMCTREARKCRTRRASGNVYTLLETCSAPMLLMKE